MKVKQGSPIYMLDDGLLLHILDELYCSYLTDYDKELTGTRVRLDPLRRLVPLVCVSRRFARLMAPKVWSRARILPNSRHAHNIKLLKTLQREDLLFPYGEYLRQFVVNFTVYQGDEFASNDPTVLQMLKTIDKRCPRVQQLQFDACIAAAYSREHCHTVDVVNRAFSVSPGPWRRFKQLFGEAFGNGSLSEVELNSEFVLLGNECLVSLAQKNQGIRKLSLKGSQFTHLGMATALTYIGNSLRDLTISNRIESSALASKGNAPLALCIDSLLEPCRVLSAISLKGVRYVNLPGVESNDEELLMASMMADPLATGASKDIRRKPDFECPLRSIATLKVDERTLERLFLHVNKQTLQDVHFTSTLGEIKWDAFLRAYIYRDAREGSLEKVTMTVRQCMTHEYSENTLDPRVRIKRILKTLRVSEGTANLLRSQLRQWRVLVGKSTGNSFDSVSEAVDVVTEECILKYDILDFVAEY